VYRVLVGKSDERDQLGVPGIDGKIILRLIFRKWNVVHGLDRSGSAQGRVAGCCKCGNERSGFVKWGEFLD
jgi:hypothetical protein